MKRFNWRGAINTAITVIRHRRWGLPDNIGMELSTACNLRCPFCIQSKRNIKQSIVSPEMWELFLYRLKEAKWKGITGFAFLGEPSLVPNVEYYVSSLHELGCMPYVFTNGRDLNAVERWIDAGAYRVVVTEQQPFTDWQQAKMKELMGKYSFWKLRWRHMQPWEIIEYADTWPRRRGGKPMTECNWCKQLMFRQDGDVVLCCIDYIGGYGLGNLKDKPIWEIWNDPHYVAVRKSALRNDPIMPVCRECLGLK